MRRPPGLPNLGGMAGMAVAGVGGLFAIGIVPAIIYRQPHILIANPMLSLLSWVVSLPLGWFLGGLLGRMMGDRFRAERPEIIGGVVGGLLALGMIAGLGWYLFVFGLHLPWYREDGTA